MTDLRSDVHASDVTAHDGGEPAEGAAVVTRLGSHRRWVRPVLGLAISAASVWLLVQMVDVREMQRTLRSTDLLLIALAVGCLFGSLAVKVLRWRQLLPGSAGVSYFSLFRILHVSIFLNNVLPLRAGDLARGAMATREPGLGLGHVVASMLAERAIDAVVLFGCFLIVAPFVARGALLPDLSPDSEMLMVLAGVVVLLGVAGEAVRRYRHLVAPMWSSTMTSFSESWMRLASREGWPIWASSLVAWAMAFAINLALFEALGMEVSPLMAVVVTCTTNLAMLVPSSPAHIGAYHAAATVTLVVAGVSPSTAASFSVVSHLVNVVPVSLVGGLLLALQGWSSLTPRRA